MVGTHAERGTYLVVVGGEAQWMMPLFSAFSSSNAADTHNFLHFSIFLRLWELIVLGAHQFAYMTRYMNFCCFGAANPSATLPVLFSKISHSYGPASNPDALRVYTEKG